MTGSVVNRRDRTVTVGTQRKKKSCPSIPPHPFVSGGTGKEWGGGENEEELQLV
jgi:hypothetical protein